MNNRKIVKSEDDMEKAFDQAEGLQMGVNLAVTNSPEFIAPAGYYF